MDGFVDYRETIAGTAEVRHAHKKQIGGAGEFALVVIQVEPIDHALGIEFVNAITGGAIPREFIVAVEAGVREAAEIGAAVGFPLIGVRATLCDGAYHEVDSNDATFRTAAHDAFRQANVKAGPVLLEPVMRVIITTPEAYVGAVLGDINGRRGDMVSYDSDDANIIITAMIPAANMFGHIETLNAITQRRATASSAFDHFQPKPGPDDTDPRFPSAVAARVA